MEKTKKRWMLMIIMVFLIGCFAAGCSSEEPVGTDQLKFQGDIYELVNLDGDVFCYQHDITAEYEEDEIYPVDGGAWKMAGLNGDLYCIKEDREAAEAYYADEANYHWEVVVAKGEEEVTNPVEITEEELAYMYELEEQEHTKAIFFEEIETQATLRKISNDNLVSGSIELALFEGQWYWRSEIIDESKEKDGTWPEYIYPMPESFQNKIEL